MLTTQLALLADNPNPIGAAAGLILDLLGSALILAGNNPRYEPYVKAPGLILVLLGLAVVFLTGAGFWQ